MAYGSSLIRFGLALWDRPAIHAIVRYQCSQQPRSEIPGGIVCEEVREYLKHGHVGRAGVGCI